MQLIGAVTDRAAMAGTEHILVVDDEEGIRLQLDEFLTSEGYRVTVVPDGAGLRQVMDNGDTSTNLFPIDILGWGEALHHNHHYQQLEQI